jgi:hypothetical protein
LKKIHALGIDLASRKWSDNGSALLSFDADVPAWTALRVPAIGWPTGALTPTAMAKAIDAFALSNGIASIALDGPQG